MLLTAVIPGDSSPVKGGGGGVQGMMGDHSPGTPAIPSCHCLHFRHAAISLAIQVLIRCGIHWERG